MRIGPIWKYRLAMGSAFLTLLGAYLVFRSFQATSSDFFLGKLRNGSNVLCVDKDALIVWRPPAMGMGMTGGCSDEINSGRVAIVTIESPTLSSIGWGLLLLGFILQLFSIEKPRPSTTDTIPYALRGPRQRSPKSK
jgi:hypothetical protein